MRCLASSGPEQKMSRLAAAAASGLCVCGVWVGRGVACHCGQQSRYDVLGGCLPLMTNSLVNGNWRWPWVLVRAAVAVAVAAPCTHAAFPVGVMGHSLPARLEAHSLLLPALAVPHPAHHGNGEAAQPQKGIPLLLPLPLPGPTRHAPTHLPSTGHATYCTPTPPSKAAISRVVSGLTWRGRGGGGVMRGGREGGSSYHIPQARQAPKEAVKGRPLPFRVNADPCPS